MKIDLGLETWTDVFGFVPRSQLAKLVPNFEEFDRGANIRGLLKNRKRKRPGRKKWSTIRNRQFVSFIQFYLHEYGRVTLGDLDITKSSEKGKIHLRYRDYPWGRHLPLADVPMSTNIKDFTEIRLGWFDQTVSRLLKEFRRNSLLTNLNINLYSVMCNPNALFTFLNNILPLITSINSVNLNMLHDRTAMGLFKTQYSKLAKPMFRSARVLICNHDSHDYNWYCKWLYTQREDKMPRILVLMNLMTKSYPAFLSFVEHLKKEFVSTKQAIRFFIKIRFRQGQNIQACALKNNEKNEKLEIEKEGSLVTISRFPMDATEEWIKEMTKYEHLSKYRNIAIDFPF